MTRRYIDAYEAKTIANRHDAQFYTLMDLIVTSAKNGQGSVNAGNISSENLDFLRRFLGYTVNSAGGQSYEVVWDETLPNDRPGGGNP